MSKTMPSLQIVVLMAGTSLALTACGDGGSSTPPSSNTPPPVIEDTTPSPSPDPLDSWRTNEYTAQEALSLISAEYAWEMGATGEGVIVGVVDKEFDQASTDDKINWHPASATVRDEEVFGADPNPAYDHGTIVSSIIGAVKDGEGIHGLAYNTQIIGYNTLSNVAPSVPNADTFAGYAQGWIYVAEQGARVINYSIGGSRPDGYFEWDIDAINYLKAWDVVTVFSAGNEGADEPNDIAKLAVHDDYIGNGIVVGSGWYIEGQSEGLDSFSNAAGSSMDYYIVAPGSGLNGYGEGGVLKNVDGTSFSAPLVTGTAALIMEAWPDLTGEEVVDLILSTAIDLGDPGTDSIYGRGFLNLEGIFTPQGVASVQTAQGLVEVNSSFAVSTSSAFGDMGGLGASLSDTGSVVVDSYGRDFRFSADNLLVGDGPDRDYITSRFDNYTAPLTGGMELGGGSLGVTVRENNKYGFNSKENGIVAMNGEKLKDQLSARFSFQAGEMKMTVAANQGGLASTNDNLLSFSSSDKSNGLSGLYTADKSVKASLYGWILSVSSNSGTYSVSRDVAREGEDWSSTGMAVARQWENQTFQIGVIHEKGQVIGFQGSGALNPGEGAMTVFARLNNSYNLSDNVKLAGDILVSRTTVDAAQASLIEAISNFVSSQWSVKLEASGVFHANDKLALSINQPLRAENGVVSVTNIEGRSYSGFNYTTNHARLSPSSREINVEAGYGLWKSSSFYINANMVYRFNENHTEKNGGAGLLYMHFPL